MADEVFPGMPILDGYTVTEEHFHERHRRVARHLLVRHGVSVPTHEAPAQGAPVPARVYRGTWIVECPTCKSAEMAWRTDPRFFCTTCLNQANGGRCLPVGFPRALEAIEEHLRVRPDPATRNWQPGESLADLRRENRDHGLVAP